MSDPGLNEGWRYSVVTEGSTSDGMFKGYAMLGSESAIVLEMDAGKIRMIPIASIIFIDLVETCDRKPVEDKRPESVYYG